MTRKKSNEVVSFSNSLFSDSDQHSSSLIELGDVISRDEKEVNTPDRTLVGNESNENELSPGYSPVLAPRILNGSQTPSMMMSTPQTRFSILPMQTRGLASSIASRVRNSPLLDSVRITRRPSYIPLDASLLDDIPNSSVNSQGYRFIGNRRSEAPFRNRISLANLVDLPSKFIKTVSGWRNSSGGERFDFPIEQARGGSEHIDLRDLVGDVIPSEVRRPRAVPFVPEDVVPAWESPQRFVPVSQRPTPSVDTESRNCCGSSIYDAYFAEMGSLHRSELMKLCQLILVKEAAYECVAEIGKHGNVQFIDLNSKVSTFARTFVNQMRRCEELERKLRFLERQVIDCIPEITPQAIDFEDLDAPSMADMVQLEVRLEQLEREFVELNNNDCLLRKNRNHSLEYLQVLDKVQQFFQVHLDNEAMQKIATEDTDIFSKSISGKSNDVPLTPLLREEGETAWFVAGVIPLDKKLAFERVLWRACRRTAFVRTSGTHFTIEDPVTLEPLTKCCFIVFFKGESLRQIIDKVCDGFNATLYPCAKSSKERKQTMFDTEARIKDLKIVIDSTQNHRFAILKDLANDIPRWLKSTQIQKSIYHIMNMFTVDTNGFLAAECWIPVKEIDNVRNALISGFKTSGTEVAPILNEVASTTPPPTLHRTNKFTKVFQSIVDSYGVSTYREVNPAPYTIITFPFLFAVMFGDAAHGLVLLLTALMFIIYERRIIDKRIRDEIFNTFFGGRYIMLLMGLFSIYTGMLYNDAFAKSVNVFGSSWSNSYNKSRIDWWIARGIRKHREFDLELTPELAFDTERGPYPFGVDPIWNIADNRLVFLNSMKMKASVIIGVSQMTFGVLLSFLNHSYYKSYIDIFTNFIPQVIFLSCIFIYLCVQIVVKWIFFSVQPGNVLGMEYPGSNCAPSLLIGLINMFMFKERSVGYQDASGNQHPTCYLNYWYPNQQLVEKILVSVALACVPVMLVGKPLFVFMKQRNRNKRRRIASGNKNNGATTASLEDATLLTPDEFDLSDDVHHTMGDIVVHQAIHTIEFVLGCVSHTASYLRLWALSLAHAQLSEVLWHMVLMKGLNICENEYVAPIVAFFIFFIFAVLSLSILIMMEGLSAFLHALRLHWVEFQSKFYQGTGHSFNAFYLRDALENAQNVSEEVDRQAEVSRRTDK